MRCCYCKTKRKVVEKKMNNLCANYEFFIHDVFLIVRDVFSDDS